MASVEQLREHNKPSNLSTLLNQLRTYYGRMQGSMKESDSFYNQEGGSVQMNLPEGLPMHITSTPTNIVDSFSDQLPTDEPVISLIARTESERPKVTKLQNWAADRLRYIREWGDVDAFDQGKKDLMTLGASCIKVIIDESRLPDKPKRKDFASKDEFDVAERMYQEDKNAHEPFRVISIPPLSVYPAPPGTIKPLPFILEEQTRTLSDMYAYDEFTDPLGNALKSSGNHEKSTDPGRTVKWLEYWSAPIVLNNKIIDPGWYIVEADGERIIEEENPYGLVPYDFTFSGLGRQHYSGDPVYLAAGLLTKIKSELSEEIRLKTAMSAQWQYHVFPIILVREGAQRAARALLKGPGKIVEWGRLGDTKPEYMQAEPPNRQMLDFLGVVMANIDRHAPSFLSNPAGSGAQFGILQSINIGQALKVIEPIHKNLNGTAGRVIGIMARLAHLRNLSFRVRGERGERTDTIQGSQFDRYDFSIAFERIDPAENERKMLVGQQLHSTGKISLRTLWSRYMPTVVDDPDSEEESILAEIALQHLVQSGALSPSIMQGTQTPLGAAQQVLGGGGAAAMGAINAGPEAAAQGASGQAGMGAARMEGNMNIAEMR